MIVDNLENLDKYVTLNPLFPKVIEYIKSLNFSDLSEGKIEVDGKEIFVIISKSALKSVSEAKLEVHNEYIDIQMPVSRSESFGWASRADMKSPVEDFDTTKDIQFFDDSYSTRFDVSPGQFVIFFPQDAHAPCLGEGDVFKVIVKIKAN